MRGRRIRWPSVRGFTLVELLVVLALLVSLAALCWPELRKPLAQSRLRDAARQLRAELGKARQEAIESGATRQFRFQPGTSRFEVTEAAAGGTATVEVADIEDEFLDAWLDEDAPADDPGTGELPGEVIFADSLGDAGSSMSAEPAEWAVFSAWSSPILFYPNGRCTSARIRLRGSSGRFVDVTLRGLTGTARIGEILQAEPTAEPEVLP